VFHFKPFKSGSSQTVLFGIFSNGELIATKEVTIPMDTNFVLVDDIVPEVRIVEIGDQGDTPAKDNITFLVAGEETVKVMVYENCYAKLMLYVEYKDSLPVKDSSGGKEVIELGNIKKLLDFETFESTYDFGFIKGREYTLYIRAVDSWNNEKLSDLVYAPVGPVLVTLDTDRDTVWPLIPEANIQIEKVNDEIITSTPLRIKVNKVWSNTPVKGLPLNFQVLRIIDNAHPYGDSLDGHCGTLFSNDTPVTPEDTLYTTIDGLSLTYWSSEIGQREIIRVRSKENYYVYYGTLFSTLRYLDDTLYIMVPGLVELQPGDYYELVGQTGYHPSNHYGLPYTLNALKEIAKYAHDTLGIDKVYYNDMSLPYGGLFDIGPPYGELWRKPHREHRTGKNCDMTLVRGEMERDFKNYISQNFGLFGKVDKDVYDEGNHWHLRLGKRKEEQP